MKDYTTIADAIFDAGYGTPHIIDDGEIHRFTSPEDKPGSNNCWYVSHRTAGAFGSWKLDTKHTWHDGKSSDNPRLLAKLREDRRQRDADMEIIKHDTARDALDLWESGAKPFDHPYIASKRITPYSARQANNMLLVPMFWNGALWNIQRIFPKRGDEWPKRYLKGGRVTGCHCLIGVISDHLLVCEGYATGCSLHERTGLPVAVAFNAGNLKPAALAMRKKYPSVQITIAADNDVETERKHGVNPGLSKAREAASAVGGDVIYPDFSDEPFDGTDYNDYLTQGGEL